MTVPTGNKNIILLFRERENAMSKFTITLGNIVNNALANIEENSASVICVSNSGNILITTFDGNKCDKVFSSSDKYFEIINSEYYDEETMGTAIVDCDWGIVLSNGILGGMSIKDKIVEATGTDDIFEIIKMALSDDGEEIFQEHLEEFNNVK